LLPLPLPTQLCAFTPGLMRPSAWGKMQRDKTKLVAKQRSPHKAGGLSKSQAHPHILHPVVPVPVCLLCCCVQSHKPPPKCPRAARHTLPCMHVCLTHACEVGPTTQHTTL
jgi:hypothetical protein